MLVTLHPHSTDLYRRTLITNQQLLLVSCELIYWIYTSSQQVLIYLHCQLSVTAHGLLVGG